MPAPRPTTSSRHSRIRILDVEPAGAPGHDLPRAVADEWVAVALDATRSSGDSRPSRAFALGWITGITHFSLTVSWIVEVMHLHGGLALPVAWMVMLLLASYLALYPALCAVLTFRAIRQFGVSGLWLAPAFWVATIPCRQ